MSEPQVYVESGGAEPDGPLPRYITVTPDEGAIITIAVPWPQIEAAVAAAGYEIVPRLPGAGRAVQDDGLDPARQACIDIMLMTVDHLDDRRLRLIH